MVSITVGHGGSTAKHSHLREMGVPILFGAVVLLVSATLLLGANISALRGNLNRMSHAQQVLSRISDLEAGIMGDEMSVRGLALTADPRFVAIQKKEQKRCRDALAALQHLVAEDPSRAVEFGRVRRTVVEHIALFGRLGEARPDRTTVVARAILDDGVRATMRRTRDSVVVLRQAELRALGDRQADVTNQLSRAFFLAVGIIVVAFLLGGIGVWTAQIKGPLKR